MNILAVIPARGGSKGIPRKNVRLLDGKELISYAIENALKVKSITHVLVSSDDEEILSVASRYGAYTITRGETLSRDAVTLDPVIFDATERFEKKLGISFDIVVTMQATSPLLKAKTIENAIDKFISEKSTSMLSVVNRAALSWGEKNGEFYPLYKERLNRQLLPPQYFETGGFLISRREYVRENSRLSEKPTVFEVPENESIDIDTEYDWMLCEMILKRKRIVLRTDGFKMRGMGHVYRCLSISYHMTGHEFMFVCQREHKDGIQKIKESFMPLTIVENEEEFYEFLEKYNPDIVVNDILNTTKEYIKNVKKYAKRVVNFEDVGSGSYITDATINALYEDVNHDNFYYGEKYVCLRDEFIVAKPKAFSEDVKNVLVLFGGSDPTNMTKKVYELAKKNKNKNITFNFITGPAYDAQANGVLTIEEDNIFIHSDIKRVSEYAVSADLAFSSQGRTSIEIASLGIPAIIMAHNERELTHTFTGEKNGFVNLGLSENVSVELLEETFYSLVANPARRKEMREKMLAHDLKSGVARVKNIILGE